MVANDTSHIQAAHLLRRAAFGATPADVDAFAALGDHAARVERLLNPPGVPSTGDAATADFSYERLMADTDYNPGLVQLQNWWLHGMLSTNHPLREKMVVFWHGHFATGYNKVYDAVYMLDQNQLLRRNALGNFKTLVKEITRDPAMMIYLDSQVNNKAHPNENYGRELMELFTIGIGNYTEDDVRAAAKAFTGLGIKGEGVVYFNQADHDTTVKTFMGKSGNFGPDDIIDIIMARPETAKFIATKLWRFFVTQDVPDASVSKVADAFFKSNYDIPTALRAIFTAPEFLAQGTLYAQIKSPVEVVVGTLRTLGAVDINQNITLQVSYMGQALFQPPTVKGWDGGQSWLNSTTFFDRVNFANQVASARGNTAGRFDLAAFFGSNTPTDGGSAVDAVLARILPNAAISADARSSLVSYVTQGGDLAAADIAAAINGTAAGSTTLSGQKPVGGKNGAPPSADKNQPTPVIQKGQPTPAKNAEGKLRGLIHLAMSLPEYQLN